MMTWTLPNQLTIARLILGAGFFVLLGLYRPSYASGRWLLNCAFVLYIVMGITDILDGWLARRWKITSAFGRIVDPFVDKVLVIGAFAMLTGANYVFCSHLPPSQLERTLPGWITGGMASCIRPWMVVVIMSREFIVSAVRGYSESLGRKFPATPAGKIKMFVQSFAICAVLYQLANLQNVQWAVVVKIIAVWAAVIVTVISGFAYLGKTRKLLSANEPD